MLEHGAGALVVGKAVLQRLPCGLGLRSGGLDGSQPFEQLGCGFVGVGEFGLQTVVLAVQPLELLLGVGVGMFAVGELALKFLQRGLRLPACGVGGTQPFK